MVWFLPCEAYIYIYTVLAGEIPPSFFVASILESKLRLGKEWLEKFLPESGVRKLGVAVNPTGRESPYSQEKTTRKHYKKDMFLK